MTPMEKVENLIGRSTAARKKLTEAVKVCETRHAIKASRGHNGINHCDCDLAVIWKKLVSAIGTLEGTWERTIDKPQDSGQDPAQDPVKIIEMLWPPDTSSEGKEMLIQALCDCWRELPAPILQRLADINRWKENSSL